MRMRGSKLTTVTIGLLLLGTAVFVQRQFARDADRARSEDRSSSPSANGSSQNAPKKLPDNPDGLEFERTVVAGTPFSATLITEAHQRMPDGTISTKTATSLIFRDDKGRTRRDWLADAPAQNAQVVTKRSVINDAVEGFSYSLDHRGNSAQRKVFFSSPGPKTHAQSDVAQRTSRDQTLPMPANSGADRKLSEGVATSLPAKEPELLGVRDIEGVLAEGTRIVSTLPAGTIGNDQPIDIVLERWYAPSLQAVVLVKRTDPRAGESIYRLTDIKRTEPAAALFKVPHNYKIIDEAGREVSSTRKASNNN